MSRVWKGRELQGTGRGGKRGGEGKREEAVRQTEKLRMLWDKGKAEPQILAHPMLSASVVPHF